ncbi:MAG: GyrI-like domain-containing protein [Candidatus Thorarchaeota archaeon]|nr:MAG: GyrI-like domain-containing protein [Candidatus Thorarchaeota archaeon]
MSGTGSDDIRVILDELTEELATVLASLAHAKRLQIARAMLDEPRNFGELQDMTELSKTALVHHVNKLVDSGIIIHVERGQYKLSEDGESTLLALVKSFANSRRRRDIEAIRRAEYIERIHGKKRTTTEDMQVRVVELKPMRVASVRAISRTPESDAWMKMRAWAEPRGLLENPDKHPIYGFNNPNPTPGKEEYGYEFWIGITPDIEPEGDVTAKEFDGGLFAVTTCNLREEMESEFFREQGYLESYKNLKDWVKSSKYKLRKGQCLERAHDPFASEEELVLEIHMPIRR